MGFISGYPKDTNISLSDKLLGTDAESSLATKNYEIGDIVAFIQGQVTATLQDVTEEGANTTVQMQINGVDVATVNDIPAAPTLQEVVAEGNTVTGGAAIDFINGSFRTIISPADVNVSNSTNVTDIYPNSIFFQKQFGSGSVELKFPNTINDARVIEFPNASGTIALKTYNETVILLSYDGTSFTYTNVINELGVTITFSNFGGIIVGALSSSVLTEDKTIVWASSFVEFGGYLTQALRASSTSFTLQLTNTNGSNNTIPTSFTNIPIRIQVYN